MFTIITGTQFGDEGKGKIVDLLAENYDIVARFQGGDNAGHTVMIDNQIYKLHQIPSGILTNSRVLIGGGVVLNPFSLIQEMNIIKKSGISINSENFGIDPKASIIMPYHLLQDSLYESNKADKIGTTKKGIGFAYQDKVSRMEIRICDLCSDFNLFIKKFKFILNRKKSYFKNNNIDINDIFTNEIISKFKKCSSILTPFLTDVSYEINSALDQNKKVLAEGAQGTHLDIIHGTQKYVTSSSTIAGSACTGLGIGPTKVTDVIGVVKAYITRVGEGPLPTELKNNIGFQLSHEGKEYGTTTGRTRRCGWFDLPLVKKSVSLNGYTSLSLTKIDVLTNINPINICVAYKLGTERIDYPPIKTANLEKCVPIYEELEGWKEDLTQIKKFSDLPKNTINYLNFLESRIGIPINIISVGPNREQTIFR